MLPNHFRTQDEIDGVDRSVYEITTENGFHVVRLHGEPIARVAARELISPKTDAWQIAFDVCAEAELPKPVWCEHDGETVFFGCSEESEPIR